MFRNSLMTAPFYSEKNKVRFLLSWLSVHSRDVDLQSIAMTTNDNENTGWLSEELAESKRVNLPLTTMTTIFLLYLHLMKNSGLNDYYSFRILYICRRL